jgi:hypothetical protein
MFILWLQELNAKDARKLQGAASHSTDFSVKHGRAQELFSA